MISAVILTKNEEKNIRECLETLKLCDEILIIDDYSDDKTIEIAKKQKLNLKIFKRHLNNDFAAQRNFGLQKASGKWILFVDADERISPALAQEIRQQTTDNKQQRFSGFYLKRKDFFGGKELKHGETSSIRLLRLGRKDAGKWQRQVHETWEINEKVGELNNFIYHFPHPTISEFLHEVNFYSTIHARSLMAEGAKPSWQRILIYPPIKFIQNYLLRMGFLDGTPGMIVAIMMSFHSFLAGSKLYLLSAQDETK